MATAHSRQGSRCEDAVLQLDHSVRGTQLDLMGLQTLHCSSWGRLRLHFRQQLH